MPEFVVRQHIDAPREVVWDILDDFGDIQRWNHGVKASSLTSEGPVGVGSTRHCEFSPFGGVDERIVAHEPPERMTIDLFQTFKLPMSHGVADFQLVETGRGTDLTLRYTYELNRLGKFAKGTTDAQLRKGLGGLVQGLATEAERTHTAD